MDKKKIITAAQKHEKDTGSADAQIALLNQRMEFLSAHLKTHPKDKHSRRGLMAMINQKKKQEKYLQTSSK